MSARLKISRMKGFRFVRRSFPFLCETAPDQRKEKVTESFRRRKRLEKTWPRRKSYCFYLRIHRLLFYPLSASPLSSHLILTESTDLEYIRKGKIIYRFSIVFSRSSCRPGMPCFALKMATVPFRFATNDRVDDKRQTSFRTCSFVRRSLFRSRQRANKMLWILVLRIDLSCVIGYAKTSVTKHPSPNTINNRLITMVGI